MSLATPTTAPADVWTGDAADDLWQSADNWVGDAVPDSDAPTNLNVDGDATVVLNGDAFDAFDTAGLLHSSGEYRGTDRFLVGDSTTSTGTQRLTFDYGNSNTVRFTEGASGVLGGRSGQNSTLNHVSGTTIIESDNFQIGIGSGTGALDVTGGSFTIFRETGGLSVTVGDGGNGSVAVSGGSFSTRAGLDVGATGVFEVVGSGADAIGIGSASSVDGNWTQATGGVLQVGIDSGGLTTIVIHDEAGGSGTSATFASGSILDVGFIDSPMAGTWTVMELENADLTDNGLTLAPTVSPDWSFNIDNSGTNGLLTVTFVPEPGSMLLTSLGCLLVGFRRRRN
jgi:hypothetical protein